MNSGAMLHYSLKKMDEQSVAVPELMVGPTIEKLW